VHNLRGVDRRRPDSGFDWAQRFDEEARAVMVERPAEVAALDRHADFDKAVPTPDHFIPLLYLAGLAGAGERAADVLVDGYTYGSLSMTAYTLGDVLAQPPAAPERAAPLPDAAPPDGANI
jgi:4,5-DOPA dioxygenase extradiol